MRIGLSDTPPAPDSRALKRLLIVACDASACDTPSRCAIIQASCAWFFWWTTRTLETTLLYSAEEAVPPSWAGTMLSSNAIHQLHLKVSSQIPYCSLSQIPTPEGRTSSTVRTSSRPPSRLNVREIPRI